jgi:hypothetical protein
VLEDSVTLACLNLRAALVSPQVLIFGRTHGL